MDQFGKVGCRNFDSNLLEFRAARAEDYQSVLDISHDVYGVFDYLPGMYMNMIHDTRYFPLLALYDSKVVSFICFIFLENGAICYSMAGRTHRDFQKLSILGQLYDYGIQFLGYENGVGRLTSVINETALDKQRSEILVPKLTWRICAYEVNVNHIRELMCVWVKNVDFDLGYLPSISTILDVLDNQQNIEYLKRRASHFMAGPWIAFTMNQQNIKYIVKQYPTCFSIKNGGDIIEAFSSYGTSFNTNGDICSEFWYIGKAEIEIWKCQTVKLMQHFMNGIGDDITLKLMFHFPEDLQFFDVEAFLKPVLGEQFRSGPYMFKRGIVNEHFILPWDKK